MTTHRHTYLTHTEPALAFFSKRGTFFDASWYAGVVERCGCGKWRFVPDERGLQTVEVEPVELPNVGESALLNKDCAAQKWRSHEYR